jgi:hypothetical protein
MDNSLETEQIETEQTEQTEQIETANKYIYLIRNQVSQDLLMNDIMGSSIYILCYHVTKTAGKYPFIQIMMEKKHNIFPNVEKFLLPVISLLSSDIKTNLSKLVLERVTIGLQELGCYPSVLNTRDAFVGLLNANGKHYALVDISAVDIYRIGISRLNNTWFALPTEIMNTQTICNIPIDEEVTQLFSTIPELGMLHNPLSNSVYPLPDAVYTGSYLKEVKFCSVFGMSKRQIYNSCGEYFYFHRIFEDAVREGGWSNSLQMEKPLIQDLIDSKSQYGKYVSGGINRYALFPGNYYMHNEASNRFSLSDDEIRNIMAVKDTIVIQYENEELDTILPDILVNEYEQFTPISYHILNKSILGDKYEIENQDKYMVL